MFVTTWSNGWGICTWITSEQHSKTSLGLWSWSAYIIGCTLINPTQRRQKRGSSPQKKRLLQNVSKSDTTTYSSQKYFSQGIFLGLGLFSGFKKTTREHREKLQYSILNYWRLSIQDKRKQTDGPEVKQRGQWATNGKQTNNKCNRAHVAQ